MVGRKVAPFRKKKEQPAVRPSIVPRIVLCNITTLIPFSFSRERPSPRCYLLAVTIVSASLNARKFLEFQVNATGDDFETTR